MFIFMSNILSALSGRDKMIDWREEKVGAGGG